MTVPPVFVANYVVGRPRKGTSHNPKLYTGEKGKRGIISEKLINDQKTPLYAGLLVFLFVFGIAILAVGIVLFLSKPSKAEACGKAYGEIFGYGLRDHIECAHHGNQNGSDEECPVRPRKVIRTMEFEDGKMKIIDTDPDKNEKTTTLWNLDGTYDRECKKANGLDCDARRLASGGWEAGSSHAHRNLALKEKIPLLHMSPKFPYMGEKSTEEFYNRFWCEKPFTENVFTKCQKYVYGLYHWMAIFLMYHGGLLILVGLCFWGCNLSAKRIVDRETIRRECIRCDQGKCKDCCKLRCKECDEGKPFNRESDFVEVEVEVVKNVEKVVVTEGNNVEAITNDLSNRVDGE